MIEMPTLAPRLRTRVKTPVPSGRCFGARVAKARVLNGTKIRPMPTPWMIPETMIGRLVIERSKWVICHRARVLKERPTIRMSRVSTRPISRPR